MPEVAIEEKEMLQKVIERQQGLYEALLSKVYGYLREELKLRGDKNLNKEYCAYFGIDE